MSGHSHWATIKHKKGAEDAKRGKVFSKISREIAIAIKEGGANPDSNNKLKMIFEKARSVNMPKDNIERVIKKATGGGADAEVLEEVMLEVLKQPEDAAVLVEAITDNKNRTLGDIKKILAKLGGKLVPEGTLKWMFERKGLIVIDLSQNSKPADELEMLAIDAGAQDIAIDSTFCSIFTSMPELEKTKKALEDAGIKIESASFGWFAKDVKQIDLKAQENVKKLLEELDDNDDIQNVYTNVDFQE